MKIKTPTIYRVGDYFEEKRTIRFEFGTSYNLKPTTYKIKLDNDNVSVKKEV